jgi:rhodanese-related sulfurtransferase
MLIYYLLGAALGGLAGYFLLYKLIGCSSGACPITANPYISVIYGVIMGLLLVSILVPSSGFLSSNKYKKITPQEAKAMIDSAEEITIVDVRTDLEYMTGHIPNAILIPNETISKTMPELLPDLDAVILVYCRSGNRSAQAAKKLIAVGYSNVYDFGGIIDWPYDIVTP